MKEGSPEEDKIEFMQRLHTIDELLKNLVWVKRLDCDEELEKYILEKRDEKGFLHHLREVN